MLITKLQISEPGKRNRREVTGSCEDLTSGSKTGGHNVTVSYKIMLTEDSVILEYYAVSICK
jgi:hypothetical protein